MQTGQFKSSHRKSFLLRIAKVQIKVVLLQIKKALNVSKGLKHSELISGQIRPL